MAHTYCGRERGLIIKQTGGKLSRMRQREDERKVSVYKHPQDQERSQQISFSLWCIVGRSWGFHGLLSGDHLVLSPLTSFLSDALYAFIKDPKAPHLHCHQAQKPFSVICTHPLALHCLQACGYGTKRKYICFPQDSCCPRNLVKKKNLPAIFNN